VDKSIKEYLRRIGAKGGKAVAGTPQAKARAAKAAKVRWTKRKQKKSEKS
jgi:ribosomal protein L12E/L44/L45/RPP1/RPP2